MNESLVYLKRLRVTKNRDVYFKIINEANVGVVGVAV